MIKRINPLMVVGVLFALLAILWISVQAKKSNIQQESVALAKYEAKAKSLKDLKGKWDSKNTLAKLNSIVSNPDLKPKTIIKNQRDKIVISVNGVNQGQIDLIVKNLLNEPFEVKKITIKRINDKTLDFNAEVKK